MSSNLENVHKQYKTFKTGGAGGGMGYPKQKIIEWIVFYGEGESY